MGLYRAKPYYGARSAPSALQPGKQNCCARFKWYLAGPPGSQAQAFGRARPTGGQARLLAIALEPSTPNSMVYPLVLFKPLRRFAAPSQGAPEGAKLLKQRRRQG